MADLIYSDKNGFVPMVKKEPTATLKLKLRSTTGYTEEATYQKVTVEQWKAINLILNPPVPDGVPGCVEGKAE